MNEFADRLESLLEDKQYSQSQLAEKLQISRSTVTGWLRYHKLPDSVLLVRLCEMLEVSADWLLGLPGNAEKVDASGNIRWTEQIPPYLHTGQQEQIEHGIRLFNQLVSRQPINLHSDTSLKYMQLSIQAAFRSGAVRLLHVERDQERETALKQRFPILKDVVVAAVPEAYDGTIVRTEFVSFLAATEVLSRVIREDVVGLGVGYTLLRMCELSIPGVDQFKGTRWLPLVTYTDDNLSGYTANQLARLMQLRHPGSEAIHLPHPDFCDTGSFAEQEFQRANRMMSNVQTMFFTVNGIGRRDRTANAHPLTDFRTADYSYDSAYLRDKYAALPDKNKFGGELLSYMLDKKGEIITYDDQRVWQIDLNVLKYMSDMIGRVCIVAARDYKAEAVLTCVRAGLANMLVIDSEIATFLLRY